VQRWREKRGEAGSGWEGKTPGLLSACGDDVLSGMPQMLWICPQTNKALSADYVLIVAAAHIIYISSFDDILKLWQMSPYS
jgi:hypothetical protein